MPNARPTPGLRLTPEKREQLRRLTEAVEHGTTPVITHEADLAARAFREIERLRAELEQLEAARAEAERWKQQYEELRARVGAVADQFGQRATDAWEAWHLHIDLDAQYAAPVWEEAEQMVRRLLTEAGGGSQ